MSGTCLDLVGCRRLFDTKKFVIIRYRDVLSLAIPRGGLTSAHVLQRGVAGRALGMIVPHCGLRSSETVTNVPKSVIEFPKREVEFSK